MSAYPSYPPPYDYYRAPPPSSYDYYGRGPPPGYGPPGYPSSYAPSYPSSYYPSRDPYGYSSGPPPEYYGASRCAAPAVACCQPCFMMCSEKDMLQLRSGVLCASGALQTGCTRCICHHMPHTFCTAPHRTAPQGQRLIRT